MRRLVAGMIAGAAIVVGAQAAQACDLEGFGYTRMNPFGQHAAWGVPSDQAKPQQSENPLMLASQPRDDARRSVQSEAPIEDTDGARDEGSARAAFVAATQTPAEQARRFTATKD